jgi:hypothetical protein
MAESSFPWEDIDTSETQFSQMFRTVQNGVNGTTATDEVKVVAGFAGLTVDVEPGQAMVQGHFYINTEAKTLTLATADGSNDRIDTIVLRLDDIANEIVAVAVTGTPALSPVPPTLTQTEPYGVYEFPLANVLVPAAAGTPGTITDRREFMGTRLGTWNTAGRPPITGRPLFGFNTDTEQIEFYNTIEDDWRPVVGVGFEASFLLGGM